MSRGLFLFFLLSISILFSINVSAEISGSRKKKSSSKVRYNGRRVGNARCIRGNSRKYQTVLKGNVRQFLSKCQSRGISKNICNGLSRPDLGDTRGLQCAYGSDAKFLVGPRSVQENGFKVGKILEELQKQVKICRVDDWFRPQAYNDAVRSTSSRHKKGGAVDILVCKGQQKKAWRILCRMKRQGRIKGLGRYPSGSVHVDLLQGGQWGGSCR